MSDKLLKALQKVNKDDIVDIHSVKPVESLSTGSYLIDYITGIGGVPIGRITEVSGPESSGKTTFCIGVSKDAQDKDMTVVYIDAENSIDLNYVEDLGVDTHIERFILVQPSTAEDTWDHAEAAITSGDKALVIIDSVAALPTAKEADSEYGAANMGIGAKLNASAMRRLIGLVRKSECTLLLVNQERDNLGAMYGPSYITPGGRAIKFAASVRIRLSGSKAFSEGGEEVGNDVRVKVIKNKMARPQRTTVTKILWGKGFDKISELAELAKEKKIIHRAGAWYKEVDEETGEIGESIGQGLESVVEKLKEDKDFFEDIYRRVFAKE